jgi:hypothetical protein
MDQGMRFQDRPKVRERALARVDDRAACRLVALEAQAREEGSDGLSGAPRGLGAHPVHLALRVRHGQPLRHVVDGAHLEPSRDQLEPAAVEELGAALPGAHRDRHRAADVNVESQRAAHPSLVSNQR